jgi:hypothetical protein
VELGAMIQSLVNINGCDSKPCQYQRMWFKVLSTPTGVKSIVLHHHQHPYCFLPSFRILFL